MKTVTQRLRQRLLAGVPRQMPDLETLRRTERCRQFEEGRTRRKIMGAFRYGLMREPGKPAYDRVSDMIRRLEAYRRDWNPEHLMDVANQAELEFAEGRGQVQAGDDSAHMELL